MFSPEWLALREPADAAARSASLAEWLVRARPHDEPDEPIRVLDLAAGTGANARYLADRWPREQHWLLVDVDQTLLARVPERLSTWAGRSGRVVSSDEHGVRMTGTGRPEIRVATRRVDLAVLDDRAVFANRDLVTASALLDLVSESWLRALAARCRDAGVAALFALTYDGTIECTPNEPEDRMIRDLVNCHQRTDKGFGPALGPDAVAVAERCFVGEGFQVRREPSDWQLPPAMRELQRELIDGWARAAIEAAPAQGAAIDRWRARRLAHVDEGRSHIVIGHEDLAAGAVTSPARAASAPRTSSARH